MEKLENLIRLKYRPDLNQMFLIPKDLNHLLNEETAMKFFYKYIDSVRDSTDFDNLGVGVNLEMCWSNLYMAYTRVKGLYLMVFPEQKESKVIFTPINNHANENTFCWAGDPTEIRRYFVDSFLHFGAILFVQNPFLNPQRYAVPKEWEFMSFNKKEEMSVPVINGVPNHRKEDILNKLLQERIPKIHWFKRTNKI